MGSGIDSSSGGGTDAQKHPSAADLSPERAGGGGLDLHSGAPWWLLADGLGLVAPPLTEDVACDVAIVGGGITGALVADALTLEGVGVVLVDARHLGQGSTLASTSLLQYDTDATLERLISKFGAADAKRAYLLGVEAIDTLERLAVELGCPFERRPSLYFCRDTQRLEELRREYALRVEAGMRVRWVEADTLESGWGLEGAGAIYSDVAAQTDPFRLCHALLGRAIARGAHVHDRTTVVRCEPSARGVHLRTDRGATIIADLVVNAAGYEAALGLPPGLVSLRSTYAIVSEPTAPPPGVWSDRALLWEFADPYLYARWTGDRLLVGGEDEDFADAARRDALIGDKTRAIVSKLRSLMPEFALEPAFAWTGTFATTPDGLGYIGALEGQDRVRFALGFGGNGITFAAVAASLLADGVMGRANQDARIFRFGR